MTQTTPEEQPTLVDLEARVDQGHRQARAALLLIARLGLYRRPGGPTFAPYVKDRFGYSRTEAYRQLRIAAIEDALTNDDESPIGDTTAPPDAHLRVLAEEGNPLIKLAGVGGDPPSSQYLGFDLATNTMLPLYATLDPLVKPLALQVAAHAFKTANDVREALAPLIPEHREAQAAKAKADKETHAVEDARLVAEAEASGDKFHVWPTETQEAWKRLNPRPQRPPKPTYLAHRVTSLARVLPDRSYRFMPGAHQDVDIHPGAPPLPYIATDAEAAAWRESNLVYTWPASAEDYRLLDGLTENEIEEYRGALARLARWAGWALERVDQIIDEERAQEDERRATQPDLSILD